MKYLSLALLIIILVPLTVQAVTIKNPLQYDNLWELIDKIIDFIFYLAIAVAPIMIIVAGFFFITAAGDPEKILRAKKMILWVLIGLLVIMSAKGLIALLGKIAEIKTPYNK